MATSHWQRSEGDDSEAYRKEVSSHLSHSSNSDKFIDIINADIERKAVLKMDMTVLPIVTMFYFLSFLDRANIGNARVAGLQKSLNMTDRQYQIAVAVVYVPYICAELPSNLILRKVGPKLLMPTLLTIWGIIVTLQGLVTSFGGLAAVRALLGLFEGPMTPGIVLYLSGFYTRSELSLRIALFFSASSLSGAFSGLLAAGIETMNGIGGRAGWSWIFILEGLFTVLMGIAGFFLLPSTPRDSKFLTDKQKDVIMERLERERPFFQTLQKVSFREVIRSITSPHVIILSIVFFMVGTTLYGLALFLPSIVNQLGFSPNKTQLLSVGPFATGFFAIIIVAYLSDKYNSRGIPTALVGMLSVIGFTVYLQTDHKFMAYGSLYITVPGVYSCFPTIGAWISNNSEPHYRRATAIAIGSMAANAGGILSTWRFPTKEGPRFRKTTIMDLTFSIFVVLFCLGNRYYLSRMNQSKKERRSELLAPYLSDKILDAKAQAWIDLGDRHPDFVYAL